MSKQNPNVGKGKKYNPLVVYLLAEAKEELDKLSKETGISQTEIVRRFVNIGLDKYYMRQKYDKLEAIRKILDGV